MPKEVFGRDHAFLERKELLTPRGDRARRRASSPGSACAPSGSPAASRSCAGTSSTSSSCSRDDSRPRARADDERRAAAAEGRGARARRARPRHGQPRLARRRGLPRAERRRLPRRSACSRGSTRPRRPVCRVKVNAVVKRGANDDGIVALAEHFRGTGHTLRFIEYMDVGHTNGWRLDDVVPADEIVRADRRRLAARARSSRPAPDETARRFRYRDGAGEIGVIASVTQPFCGGCSRARLSAEGRLYTCLFALEGPRPARAAPARRRRRGARRDAPRRLGRAAPTAIRSSAPPRRAALPEGRDVVHRRVIECLAAVLIRISL